jgi:hypothetical protein
MFPESEKDEAKNDIIEDKTNGIEADTTLNTTL